LGFCFFRSAEDFRFSKMERGRSAYQSATAAPARTIIARMIFFRKPLHTWP